MAKAFAQLVGLASVVGTLDSIVDNWSTNKAYGVAAMADYSSHVEFGTWKMDAQPFMRPAVDSARGQIRTLSRRANSIDQLLYLLSINIRDFARRYAAVDTGYMKNNIVVTDP